MPTSRTWATKRRSSVHTSSLPPPAWNRLFAAISPTYGRQWFAGLLERLLRGDAATLKLLRHNPFPESPPIYVRAQMFRYRYSTPSELRHDRVWWHRAPEGEYFPPVTLPD